MLLLTAFQSSPDPDAIAPCGYATMNPSRSATAFMPLNAACFAAVEPEPCMLSTSATRVRSVNPDGRCTSTVRCTPSERIDTVNEPVAVCPLHALVGSVVGCALTVAAAAPPQLACGP